MTPEELKSIMYELRLTQRSVSELLSVNIRTVRSWVSGSRRMNGCAVVALRALMVLVALGHYVAGSAVKEKLSPALMEMAKRELKAFEVQSDEAFLIRAEMDRKLTSL